ncbi:histidinol-phosphate transaminase [Limnobacter humi]|uniref:Histidinol-phosphate aminotransferase n=1 Tax=Limnobacter humi TaxID=1778671 RepID=A0ABT1WJI7_9BURK|nr:histidinol-phosphate transaminase [Limnobacter humi]MCQ8896589.1 histidinol-phosphate transaminase [Limnobacter humi]
MSQLTDLAPQFIRAIAPYKAGKPVSDVVRELGLNPETVVKLASNENPLGLGSKAKAAIAQAAADLGRYPDANGFSLKAKLSTRHSVGADQITLGNGSNDVLELAAKAFLTQGTNAVFSQYAFAVYPLATQGCGAQSKVVPAANLTHDLTGFLAAIDDNTRVVFIANPNNPTGTFLAADQIRAFLKQVPSRVLVVLDEAYNEFLKPEDQYDSTQWVAEFPNLLVSRSFSKAYGLAGLRVGYAVSSPEVADLLNRVRQPFNVNSIALAAAEAALDDAEFLQLTYETNQQGLNLLQSAFERMGLPYVPSYGNFVLVKVGNSDDAGLKVFDALQRLGVIVRPVNNYGLPQWLRISIGLPAENQRFLDALPEALKVLG